MPAISTSTAANFSSDGSSTGATSSTGLLLWDLIRFVRMLDFPSSNVVQGRQGAVFVAVVSIHSGKCYCSPGSAVATPVIDASDGRHPPVLCSCLLLASATRRLLGVVMAFLWELPTARVIDPRLKERR